MTAYVADESGAPVCVDCATGACITPSGYQCQAEHCQCACRDLDDPDSYLGAQFRARERDDRPDPALHSIARDIEAENRPTVPELNSERYDRPSTHWRKQTCRSCGKPIIWAVTAADKAMPVDAQPVAAGTVRLIPRGRVQAPRAEVTPPAPGRYVSHFATCPQASTWRRKQGAA